MALRCVGLCESDPRNPKIWGENVGPENKKDKTDSTSTVSQKIHSFQAIVSYPTEDILILQARTRILISCTLPLFTPHGLFSILSLIFGGNHRRASPTPRERHQCIQPSCNRPEMTYQMRCNLFYLQYTATEFDYANRILQDKYKICGWMTCHATFFFLQ